MVKIRKVDVITEVSMLASQLALPRDDHAEVMRAAFFACLDNEHDSRAVFDPTHAEIKMDSFKERDWRALCGNVSKSVPPNVPEPCGKEAKICTRVDSDHARHQLIRRLRAAGCFALWLLCVPQFSTADLMTVETSVFGAEFVAVKSGVAIAPQTVAQPLSAGTMRW